MSRSNTISSRHSTGLALMLASTVCFTANVLLIRALGQMQAVNVWLVACVRFCMGLGLIGLIYRRELQAGHLFTRGKLVVRGLVGGLGVYAYYLTVVHLGAGRATFINNTYVIWSALLAAWLLGERLRPAIILGGAAALTGLALLTNVLATGASPNPYDLVAVACAVASAYVVVMIRQLHATEHTATIFSAQCVYGLLICGGPAVLHPESVAPIGWLVMLLAGICAGAGQLAMTRAFLDLPVTEGALLQMLVPLGIALGGTVFFAERFSPHELLGAALILGGTAASALRAPMAVPPDDD